MDGVKEPFALPLMGWIPDQPDFRDRSVVELLKLATGRETGDCASSVDLREYFPNVEQSGSAASTAFACGGLVEYFRRRFTGELNLVSKWFLYHVARRYEGIHHGTGVSLRAVLKAIVRAGIPPARFETFSPEIREGVIDDPVLYSFAEEFRQIRYFRIAAAEKKRLEILRRLLHAGMPCVFGCSLPSSLSQDARIDYRAGFDSVIGGTAGVFVGYDDNFRLSVRGALMFRSCWGTQWGDHGYGWLDYRFVESGMIQDIWTISHPAWNEFGCDKTNGAANVT